MIALLKKEFRLAMHPVCYLLLCLSAMVMIPNYPYSVIFFYTTLGLFFTCLLGRENNDVVYTMMLPVAKSDIVKARILMSVIIELIQMVIAIPFCILRQNVNAEANGAGMDANIAFFAVGFIIFAFFHLVFFPKYYRRIGKVGVSFIWASVVVFLLIMAEITSTYAIPFVRDYLDTKDTQYVGYKLIVLAISIVIYIVITVLSYQISKKNFEIQDMNS